MPIPTRMTTVGENESQCFEQVEEIRDVFVEN